jgi:acyl carrier protein
MPRICDWLSEVSNVLRDLDVDVASVDVDLFETGRLDSLTFVELLLRVEEGFGVPIDLDTLDIAQFRSVRSMAAWLAEADRGAAARITA